jgi:hypothetical protein
MSRADLWVRLKGIRSLLTLAKIGRFWNPNKFLEHCERRQ